MASSWARCSSRRSAGRLQQLCVLLVLLLLCSTVPAASSDLGEGDKLQEQLPASGALNVTSDAALTEGLSQGVAGLPKMARHVPISLRLSMLHVKLSHWCTPCPQACMG